MVAEYLSSGSGDRKRVKEALEARSADLSRIEEAARMRRCEWKYPEQVGYGKPPHLQGGVSIARLLAVRARMRLEDGEVDAGLRDLAVLYRLGSDFLLDQALISNLVGLVCFNFSQDVLQTVFQNRTFNSDQYRFLAAHAETTLSRVPPFRKCMEHERDAALSVLDRFIEDPRTLVADLEGKPVRPEDKGGEEWNLLKDILQSSRDASRKALKVRIEEHWKDVLFDAEQPLWIQERKVNTEELKKTATRGLAEYKVRKDADQGMAGATLTYVLLVNPAVEKAKRRHAIGRLCLQLHASACRLEVYRAENGSFPEAFRQLAFSTTDPFDGANLKYRRWEAKDRSAFVLTAAGPNQNWEGRIRMLAEESGFDREKYENRNLTFPEDLEYTIWASRPR